MRNLWILLMILAWPALAQGPPAPKVLVLPPVIRGEFLPLSSAEFTQVLTDEIHRLAPKASVIVPRPQDLGGLGYQTSSEQPPSLDEARRLCAGYQATHAVWLSVRFRPELTPASGTSPSVLALGGAARLWIMQLDTGRVAIDEPVSVVRSSVLPAGADPEKISAELGRSCAHDLAQQVVMVAQQRAAAARVAGWSKPVAGGPSAGTSPGVKTMSATVERYRRAVDSGDLISATDTQRSALSSWRSLSRPEQMQVERLYPGTLQWMEGGVYYNVNGFWR